jgi:hypothetical protein
MKNMRNLFAVLVVLVVSTGCAGISSNEISTKRPKGSVVVFARIQEAYQASGKENSVQTDCSEGYLLLTNDSSDSFGSGFAEFAEGTQFISFDRGGIAKTLMSEDNLVAYIINSGKVYFKGIKCTRYPHASSKNLMKPPVLIGDLKPDTAYYLGDITAQKKSLGLFKGQTLSFDVRDNFDASYKELGQLDGMRVVKKLVTTR